MTTIYSVSPAKYWRETQNWPTLIDQTGIVMAATQIQFGLPELASSTPYWLVLVKLNTLPLGTNLKLFLGAAGYSYQPNDRVKCVLRRLSSSGNGLIHYGVKVSPAKT